MAVEITGDGNVSDYVPRRAAEAPSILARIRNGFAVRSTASDHRFEGNSNPPWLDQERPSVFAALIARLDYVVSAPPYAGDDRWVYIEAALTAPTLGDQHRLVASITHPQDSPFVATYCVGALFASDVIDFETTVLLDSTDLSILCESLAIADRVTAPLAGCLELSDQFIQGRFSAHQRNFDVELIRETLIQDSPGSGCEIAAFQKRLQTLKRTYVHTFGPDIFSSLQALVEPEMNLTEAQLLAIERLTQRWGLAGLFYELLLWRILGPYTAEQAFIRDRLEGNFAAHLSPRQRAYASAILNATPSETPPRARRGSVVDQLLQLMARVRAALAAQDPATLTDAVIDLFELEPLVIGFLPWDRIRRVLAHQPRDARAAFLTLLMTDEAVRKRYPRVGMALGKGALIADLQALIDLRRTDAIGALLSQVKSLPERAAGTLARAILDRPIMERLASSLPDPRRWIGELPGLDRGRVSSMTLGALRAAGQRNLISDAEMRRQIEREVEDLRFHMLQSQLRTGRVKVAWKEIETGLDAFFASALPMTALQISASQGGSSSLAPRLADYTAQRISNFLILESEYCIKQALSSNLRHGVMLPRFLRAFDDAVQTTWGAQSLLSWEPDAVRERMGDDGLLILALRERVSSMIKLHMADWLNVDQDSAFELRLHNALRERILTHFTSPQPKRPSALRSSLVAAARVELRTLLRRAAKSLAGPTRRLVNQELRSLGRTVKGRATPELRSYIDFLQGNVHQAFDEVGQWIRLVNARSEALPFRLSQVVRLHLLDSALFARAPLKVTTEVTLNGRAHNAALINGKYLSFFEEVVRNLLSNAFKGSGDELKTQAEIHLAISPGRMVLRCTNLVNPSRVEQVITNYRHTVDQAQRRNKVQARQDQRSGFQKIRVSYLQSFGIQPTINIPPVTSKTRRFIVEITVPLRGEDMFSLEYVT